MHSVPGLRSFVPLRLLADLPVPACCAWLQAYSGQLGGDPIVHSHLSALYDTLLEQNLIRWGGRRRGAGEKECSRAGASQLLCQLLRQVAGSCTLALALALLVPASAACAPAPLLPCSLHPRCTPPARPPARLPAG